MVFDTSLMREYECINTFDPSCCINWIDWDKTVSDCWGVMHTSTYETLLVEVQIWQCKTFDNATCVHILIKVSKEDDVSIRILPHYQPSYQLVKKYWSGRPPISSSLDVSFMLLSHRSSSRIGRTGARGLKCHDYSSFLFTRSNLHPAPSSQVIGVHSSVINICWKLTHCHHCAPTMLVPVHLLVNVVYNNTPCFHHDPNHISELLLLRCLAPESTWVLHPAKKWYWTPSIIYSECWSVYYLWRIIQTQSSGLAQGASHMLVYAKNH